MNRIKSTGNVHLKRGTHTYNFQCNLPAQLPTSVEGNIGYIRYTARVIMDIPMALDKDFKQRFTVIRSLNLNSNPAIRVSILLCQNYCALNSVYLFFCWIPKAKCRFSK